MPLPARADMAAALRGGAVLYASALLLDRLLGLLLLPLLTRAVSQADYGAWAQTAVATSLLMPLVLLATPTAIVRWFSAEVEAQARRRSFWRVGLLAAALGLGVAAVAGAWREPLARVVYGEDGRTALVPALLALLAAEATVDFATAWLRAAGRMGWIATVLSLRSLLRYALVLWLVTPKAAPLQDWLGAYAGAQCGLALLVFAGVALHLGRGGVASPGTGPQTDIETAPQPASVQLLPSPSLRSMLAFCLPLVALALFTAFNASFDRFLLVRLLGLETVAVYAAAASLCGVTALVYSVLGFTLFPVLARHWAAGRQDEVARLTSLALQAYAFVGLPLVLLLALSGPAVLPLLSTADYRPPPAVFALLALSVASFGLYQILLYPLLLGGRSGQVLGLAVAAAVLNVVLNLVLAPRAGVIGAAAAAVLTHGAMVLWSARLTAALLPWRFPWAALAQIALRAGLAALPLAWALWPWGAEAPGSWTWVAAMVLLSALLYLALDRARARPVTRMLLAR